MQLVFLISVCLLIFDLFCQQQPVILRAASKTQEVLTCQCYASNSMQCASQPICTEVTRDLDGKLSLLQIIWEKAVSETILKNLIYHIDLNILLINIVFVPPCNSISQYQLIFCIISMPCKLSSIKFLRKSDMYQYERSMRLVQVYYQDPTHIEIISRVFLSCKYLILGINVVLFELVSGIIHKFYS